MRTFLLRVNEAGQGIVVHPDTPVDVSDSHEYVKVVSAKDYLAMKARVNGKGVEAALCADPHDGNDPLEARIVLPFLPRKDDLLQVDTDSGTAHLRVALVMFSLLPAERDRIEVWVDMEGYEKSELVEAMGILKDRQPA